MKKIILKKYIMRKIVFMCIPLLVFTLSLVLVNFYAYPEKIRTVWVNDTKMQSINLKMGRASILRFLEPPKKVVVGNQNYYSIEFIENDLTIQPLEDVETNLFVYTPYHTYGFILHVCYDCHYDDLVFVRWRPKYLSTQFVGKKKKSHEIKKQGNRETKKPVFPIPMKFNVDDVLSVEVVKITLSHRRSVRIIDLNIKNMGVAREDLSSLRILASRKKIPLKHQSYVVEKRLLKGYEESRARLFIPSMETRKWTLTVVRGQREGKILIEQRYLK